MQLPPGIPPSRRFVAGWALLAGAVMFALGMFHHDFPCEYHPDEPSKVAQLLDGTRNYHHPPLMLALADAAPSEVPVAGVQGRRRTVFFVDAEAASQVPKTLIASQY